MVVTNSTSSPAHILVTLTGYDEKADEIDSREVPFYIPASDSNQVQIMRQDILTNFQAEYVTVRIQAWSTDADTPAPKIHALRIGVDDRATTIRHGQAPS